MTFKTALCVTEMEHSDQDVRTAADLCAEVGARLSVLIIKFTGRRPFGAGPALWPERIQAAFRLETQLSEIQTFSREIDRLVKRSREIHTLLEAMGIPSDVYTDYCDQACVGDAVRQRALCADLVVIGPSLLNDDDLGPAAINGCLFESGKPVLVVPRGAKASLRPQRILVGWDTRVETSRAIRGALHLLSGADQVRVTLVDPEAIGNGNGPGPGIDIVAYLARHGIRVVVDRLPSVAQSVTTILVQHAIDTAADMVVMGAWSRPRLRERIFGGVIGWMIEKPRLPLFAAA
ncbi:universal stress protein [Mesorhizobium sp. SARCC-RB16n]|uniref:universal stress protein n=1 Tax=Mesorhizobium sp. SARCC-RB16n TaxID=2116687 RepID=UPI00122FA032|nr:universal stress protein [Mesorhizobium sp. SARCC-RB16n]KAA3448433.1 universal stress protein [Mesorhizobium sp. SARCC-RB16n]